MTATADLLTLPSHPRRRRGFKHPAGLLPLILLLCIVPTADAAPPWNVGYRNFIASFPPVLKIIAGEGARDPGGFDRDALHAVMNREIVEFFNRTLPPAGNTPIKDAQPPSLSSSHPVRWCQPWPG